MCVCVSEQIGLRRNRVSANRPRVPHDFQESTQDRTTMTRHNVMKHIATWSNSLFFFLFLLSTLDPVALYLGRPTLCATRRRSSHGPGTHALAASAAGRSRARPRDFEIARIAWGLGAITLP